ncbi:hypothetical protein [Actinomadura rugatobispora]|uniref:Uncharacterized protein n=1 Tax=Actinomadura rugatobispora TaxID=1994 RepID=A0ABW0ZZW3_9ACTN|nr:hypothetical protein GCM10010200_083990 [Actinomadura rugatobispora]
MLLGRGGQAAKSARIENYLGFPHGISGEALARPAMVQALKSGVRIQRGRGPRPRRRAPAGRPAGRRHPDRGPRGDRRYRRLDVPRWAAFEKRGCIHHAATDLDVRGYGDHPVAVVGGANSAGQAALSLAPGMSSYLVDRIRAPGSGCAQGRVEARFPERIESWPSVPLSP